MSTNYQYINFQSKSLSNYIDSYSIIELNNSTKHRFIPKGYIEIIIPLNCNFKHKSLFKGDWINWSKCFIAGLHNAAYEIKPLSDFGRYLSIKFKPYTAKNFFDFKLHALKNSFIEVSDIWCIEGKNLTEKIVNTSCDFKKIEIVEKFLIKKLVPSNPSKIDFAVNLIRSENGIINLNHLAKKIELSPSHFRKSFNENIGMSPSQYSKVIRINNAFKLKGFIEKKSLTQTAYKLGYFDQSHFIKDFKSITNHTPKILKLDNYLR